MGTRSKPSKRTLSKSEKLVPFSPAGFYPYTKAAREIADHQGEGLQPHWTEKMLRAISDGKLPAYDRDGGLLGAGGAKNATVLHIVRKDDVNAWLKQINHEDTWTPIQESSGTLATTSDLTVLATRKQLIDAFGARTGMCMEWFHNLSDRPALQQARKVTGIGGKNWTEPMFCPYEVMDWLCNGRRRSGRKLREEKGWEILKRDFPKVYSARYRSDMRPD